jgi:hypothetical protein
MITLRYHIASLVAVLLTLGLGIWIGTAIGSPGLTFAQKQLINESNVKFDQELAKREEEEKRLDQNRQALAGLVPHFTHGLLYGKRIAIVRTGDYPNAVQNASDALTESGAAVTASISVSDQFDDLTDKERRQILGLLSNSAGPPSAPGDASVLFAILVEALKDGTADHPAVQTAVDAMSDDGLITYSGDFQQPVDLIIVVGGYSAEPGELEATDDQAREEALLNLLVSPANFSPLAVVGCESSDVNTSSIPQYKDAEIGSVDCIDEPLGGLDLVYALHGEGATYGVKSGATLLAPASLETADGGF